MSIVCLIKGHDWKFGYNHGVPLGTSLHDALKMLESGEAYEVQECARRGCGKQSRMVNGERVVLKPHEMERP